MKLKWNSLLPVFVDFVGVIEWREYLVSASKSMLTDMRSVVFFIFLEMINCNIRLFNSFRFLQFDGKIFEIFILSFKKKTMKGKMLFKCFNEMQATCF